MINNYSASLENARVTHRAALMATVLFQGQLDFLDLTLDFINRGTGFHDTAMDIGNCSCCSPWRWRG